MATFHWKAQNPTGCPFCGTSTVPEGFVDCIGDTHVMDADGQIVGFVDVIPCAICVRQMADLVGCQQPQAVMETTHTIADLQSDNEKLRDEVEAWTQRFNNLVDAISRGAGVDDNPDLALSGVVRLSDSESALAEAEPETAKRTRKRAH